MLIYLCITLRLTNMEVEPELIVKNCHLPQGHAIPFQVMCSSERICDDDDDDDDDEEEEEEEDI